MSLVGVCRNRNLNRNHNRNRNRNPIFRFALL